MNKISIIIVVVCTSFCAFAQNTDEQNIKTLLEKQAVAYHNRDFAGWASALRQDSKLARTFISNNSYVPVVGWDSSKAQAERHLELNPKPAKFKATRNFRNINIHGKMAWVDYDQVIRFESDTFDYVSHEIRLLTKENDEWRIANQVSINTASFNASKPAFIEENLNATGYALLAAKRLNDAVEVFRLNVKLFPNEWNPYDSLGEAYALLGNKKLAIENYEKSVKLNPNNNAGIAALSKLKGK